MLELYSSLFRQDYCLKRCTPNGGENWLSSAQPLILGTLNLALVKWCANIRLFIYSNHPNTEHPNTGFSWYRTYCMSGYRMAFWHLWTQTIWKPDLFVPFSTDLGPQMSKYHSKTGQKCSVFEWHLKTGLFKNRTCLDHLKTELVRYSNAYCSWRSKQFIWQ